jgi:glycosyltransferase involved in cell wall biosynthesis
MHYPVLTNPKACQWPRISIVTPSYNQEAFIDETICSVLSQGYPNLEYVVIDGGSTDGSVEIIRKYEHQLTYWVSEHDAGQYDAINKGFSKATGDIMAWLNSDDKYMPWTFQVIGDIFSTLPEVEWLTTLYPIMWDASGRATGCHYQDGYSRQGFFRGENLPGAGWYARCWIQQESTFWRRSLWERTGGYVDASLALAGDFELWARFFKDTELYGVGIPLGGFRVHDDQKTARHLNVYLKEAEGILRRHGGLPYGKLESFLHWKLLRHIPVGFKRRMRLAYRSKVCVYSGSQAGWKVMMIW